MSISATSPWNAAVAARLSRAAETLMSRAELAARAAVAPKRLKLILDHAGAPTLDEFYNICAALELNPATTLGDASSHDNSLSSLRLKVVEIDLAVRTLSASSFERERRAAARHVELYNTLSVIVAQLAKPSSPIAVQGPRIGILDAEQFRQFQSQTNYAEPSA